MCVLRSRIGSLFTAACQVQAARYRAEWQWSFSVSQLASRSRTAAQAALESGAVPPHNYAEPHPLQMYEREEGPDPELHGIACLLRVVQSSVPEIRLQMQCNPGGR